MTREEAINNIKKLLGLSQVCDEALGTLIPELNESEDERIIKTLQEYVKNRNWALNGPTQDEVLAWLEKQKDCFLVPKSHSDPVGEPGVDGMELLKKLKEEWSEEDSDNLERIDDYLWMLDNYVGDDCAMPQGKTDKIRGNIQGVLSPWIKSLPERFVLQPKKEWSKEDEDMRNNIIRVLNSFVTVGCESYLTYSREIDWLQALYPSWKPSEEQMRALRLARSFVVDDFGEKPTLSETLKELEEQLEKLM